MDIVRICVSAGEALSGWHIYTNGEIKVYRGRLNVYQREDIFPLGELFVVFTFYGTTAQNYFEINFTCEQKKIPMHWEALYLFLNDDVVVTEIKEKSFKTFP